jgi:hypothetical protein
VPDPVGIVTVVLPIVVPELEAVTVKLFCVVHSLLYSILTSTLSAEVPEEAPLQGLPSTKALADQFLVGGQSHSLALAFSCASALADACAAAVSRIYIFLDTLYLFID